MAFGETHHCVLGNHELAHPSDSRFEYCVAGPAVHEAGNLLGLTKSGDALFSLECWSILKTYLKSSVGENELNALWDLSGSVTTPSKKKDHKTKTSTRSKFSIGHIKDSDGFMIQNRDSYLHEFVVLLNQFSNFIEYNNESAIQNEALASGTNRELAENIYSYFIEESLSKMISIVNRSRYNNQASDIKEDEDFTIKAQMALEEYNQVWNITSVFIRFPTLDVTQFAKDDILTSAQNVLSTVMKITEQNGGCCRQFGCDDKATTVLLVWGMEGFSHERGESYYAVKAAVEMALEFQKILNGAFSIGIATGIV